MLSFPYGLADFHRIRREGRVYVDRTAYIRELERLGDTLVFLRPRRFGKSLWLQTLANYYDLRRADEFDALFGGLAIGADPTPLANRFFVLQWNFSEILPDGDVAEITRKLHDHVRDKARIFGEDYGDHLPRSLRTEGEPPTVLGDLLAAVRRTPYKVYLLIDEYDNFINDVMVRDRALYQALFEADGPYRALFKTLKASMEGRGLERVFVTGVSPVALNDLTSGFNIAENVSLKPELAALCGFTHDEVHRLLERVAEDRGLSASLVEQAAAMMRTWYNGYRFTQAPAQENVAPEVHLIYNPTSTLYFLKELQLHETPPKKLHDANLRTDGGKLSFLARTSAGAGVVEQLTEGDGTVEIVELEESFSLEDLSTRVGRDPGAAASLLYYMGLLTLTDDDRRLRIPNLVVRKLFLERLLEIYLPDVGDDFYAREVAKTFLEDGDLEPLLAFFEEKLLPVLSNRDRGAAPRTPSGGGSGVNEMVIKALFLSVLFDDTRHAVFSELELDKRYAGELPPVKAALDEAREQVRSYRAALMKRFGETSPAPRAYAVVALGVDRLLGEEVAPEGAGAKHRRSNV